MPSGAQKSGGLVRAQTRNGILRIVTAFFFAENLTCICLLCVAEALFRVQNWWFVLIMHSCRCMVLLSYLLVLHRIYVLLQNLQSDLRRFTYYQEELNRLHTFAKRQALRTILLMMLANLAAVVCIDLFLPLRCHRACGRVWRLALLYMQSPWIVINAIQLCFVCFYRSHGYSEIYPDIDTFAAAGVEQAEYEDFIHLGQCSPGISCRVCLEDLEPDSTVALTRCRHAFHADCLRSWFDESLTCPFRCPANLAPAVQELSDTEASDSSSSSTAS